MDNPFSNIHRRTWWFLQEMYREWYLTNPNHTLQDWLSTVRLCHSVFAPQDMSLDRTLGEAITVLEYAILARGGQLPAAIGNTLDEEQSHDVDPLI